MAESRGGGAESPIIAHSAMRRYGKSIRILKMTQEIHFVTGKGGVGKSMIAAGLAVAKAKTGAKTLLVELGDLSYFSHFFQVGSVGYEPTKLADNLSLALWNGHGCLKEYIRHLVKIEALFRLFYDNRVSLSLINVAPALKELAILGKITSDVRHHGPPVNFDVIVVDAFSTGHFLSLMRGPRGMAEAIPFGPMGEQSRQIDKVLLDQKICKYHAVCTPEDLPVRETVELCHQLRQQFTIETEIILNRAMRTFLVPQDIQSIRAGSDASAFLDFLEAHVSRTNEALREFSQANLAAPKRVDFLSQSDPWELTNAVAQELQ